MILKRKKKNNQVYLVYYDRLNCLLTFKDLGSKFQCKIKKTGDYLADDNIRYANYEILELPSFLVGYALGEIVEVVDSMTHQRKYIHNQREWTDLESVDYIANSSRDLNSVDFRAKLSRICDLKLINFTTH